MTTLTEWLLAQIAEDEAVAREADDEGYGEWQYAIVNQSGRIQTVRKAGSDPVYAEHLSITHDSEGLSDSVSDHAGPHIARHDPARVLAEYEAKRRIVELHGDVDPCDAHDASFETIPCDTLRLLALPYADRPGYREEWKP